MRLESSADLMEIVNMSDASLHNPNEAFSFLKAVGTMIAVERSFRKLNKLAILPLIML